MRNKSITAAELIFFALLVAGCSPKSESTSVEAKANAASAEHKPNLPPANPFLMSDSIYPMIHWNSAATDITTAPAWIGNHVVKPEQIQWQPMAPSSVGAAHYPYPGGEHAMILSGNNSVSKMRITDGAFELIDRVTIPGYDAQNATEQEIRDLAKAIEAGGGRGKVVSAAVTGIQQQAPGQWREPRVWCLHTPGPRWKLLRRVGHDRL